MTCWRDIAGLAAFGARVPSIQILRLTQVSSPPSITRLIKKVAREHKQDSASDPRVMNLETPIQSPSPVLLKLYTSHFLSTWNSRTFEFGAILFLASIFPGTLLYASSYALVRALAAVLLSSWVGSYVDSTDRLMAIRKSIVWQRMPVALSCVLFLVLRRTAKSHPAFWLCFPALIILACCEKLASIANTVAIERDWTIVISESTEIKLQDLNSVLRRIDLICKLVAPVFISFLATYSTKGAILLVMIISSLSSLLE